MCKCACIQPIAAVTGRKKYLHTWKCIESPRRPLENTLDIVEGLLLEIENYYTRPPADSMRATAAVSQFIAFNKAVFSFL